MAKFETLESDIKKMLAGDFSHDGLEFCTDTAHNVLKLAKNVATHTLEMVNHRPPIAKDKDNLTVRMSELGEPCLRKLMYKWYTPYMGMYPYAELPTPYLPVKFTYGDYIEELALFLASEAGHTVSHRQQEVRVPVSNGWVAVGHIDAMIDNVIVDVKSAADVSFNKYKRESLTMANDSFGYIWQIDGYAYAMGVEERAFMFMNKHDGEILMVDRSKEEFYPIPDRVQFIAKTVDSYNGGIQPDRLPTKSTKYGDVLGTVCSYCPFKYACYDGGIQGVIVSSRPMYFVTDELTKEGYDYIKDKAQIAKPPAYT